MKRILTTQETDEALDALYRKIVDNLPTEGRVALIGIRTRGETITARLVDRMRAEKPGLTIDHGVLDVTFYRDDLSRRRGAPLVRATEIDFDIDDVPIILIDDVVHTGRSVRAALDALHDFGRPRAVRLGVLIDRGGRELPIAADYVGREVTADDTKRVQVRLRENDGEEGVFIINRY